MLRIDPVIPDEGKCEHQDLPGIPRIGQWLHVTGHLRREDEFAGTCPFNAKTVPDNRCSVFKTQNCLHDFTKIYGSKSFLTVMTDRAPAPAPLQETWNGGFF
jgi:hypothetical protein